MDISSAHSSRLVTTARDSWQDQTVDTMKPTITARLAGELVEYQGLKVNAQNKKL